MVKILFGNLHQEIKTPTLVVYRIDANHLQHPTPPNVDRALLRCLFQLLLQLDVRYDKQSFRQSFKSTLVYWVSDKLCLD